MRSLIVAHSMRSLFSASRPRICLGTFSTASTTKLTCRQDAQRIGGRWSVLLEIRIPLFLTYDEIRANSFKYFWANSFYFEQIIYGSIGAPGYNSFSKNRTDSFDRLKFFFAGSV